MTSMTTLTPSQLIALHEAAHRSVAEVAESEPELFAALDELLSADRRSVLLRAMPAASDPLRGLLARMDLSAGPGVARSLLHAYADGLATAPELDEQTAVEGLTLLAEVSALDDPAALAEPLRAHPTFA